MTGFAAFLALLLAGFASACGSTTCDCDCPAGLEIEITNPRGARPVVRGTPELRCSTWEASTTCTAYDVEAGSYTYEITLAGHAPQTVTVEAALAERTGGCCTCRYLERTVRVTLVALDGGPPDAGTIDASTIDAGTIDAGTIDASTIDAGAIDASTIDAGAIDASVACRPERVELQPPGGALSLGTLCDDVFACVPDAAAAAALQAASSVFDCASEGPGDPCAAGSVRCAYRDPGGPSVLDAAELARICAITVLEPPPERIVCRVYL